MAKEEQPIERVQVIYVVSRVIEFIDLANGDTLANRLRQLHELILRDKAQSKANLAQTTAEVLPALKVPAWQSWPKTTSRRALPAVRHSVPVENRYVALGESQGLCGDGGDDAGWRLREQWQFQRGCKRPGLAAGVCWRKPSTEEAAPTSS